MSKNKNQIFNFEPFNGFSDESKKILSEKVKLISFDIGEQLIDENIIPGRVLVVLNGSARCLIREKGKLKNFRKYEIGAIIGAASIMTGHPCENYTAGDELEAFSIEEELWSNLYENDEKFKRWCDSQIWIEEVAYLILNGELPDNKQLKSFEKIERKERKLSKSLLDSIKNFPKKSHPMDVARTAVSIMGLEDKETKDNSPKANMRKVMRIFAKTPTALAAFYRLRKGKKIISPKSNLSFSENFFYMCFGKVPNKEIVKAFDVSLILYAEHSFNVSTFTARTITSSLSDIHGAITGAIASLKGPLHGGAVSYTHLTLPTKA